MNNNNNCASKSSCSTGKEHIKGIKCDVKNCIYHDCDTYCTANMIAVCNSKNEASCGTFMERK